MPKRTGKRNIPRPITRHIFTILDPITSPNEISIAFWVIEENATDVSGREVPIAIIVAPTISGDIFILPENFSINLRRKFAEVIKNIRENAKTVRRLSMALNKVYTKKLDFQNMFSQEKGLPDKEVIESQKKYGPNILPEKPPPGNVAILLNQLKSPLVFVLLLAALVTLTIGHFSDALLISIAVFINTLLGFLQEKKAGDALSALKRYIAHTSLVIREGRRVSVNTSALVPGDLVILSQGVRVPADGVLVGANRFFADESILSGESVPVEKKERSEVMMGTTVTSGQGIMRVATIGAATKIGSIAQEVQKKEPDTPLERSLKKFSRQILILVLTLTVFIVLIGVIKKIDLENIFVTSVALAVSSIPEGLLVSLTVILAIGMQRILGRGGLVRKLSAAETLGTVTVICADKTGTLTQGKMQVVEYVGKESEIATQALLANDLDDPILVAAFDWAKKRKKIILEKFVRMDSIPFSSKDRFFLSLSRWSGDGNMIFINGAPEILIEKTDLPREEKGRLIAKIDSLSESGRRVIGFARKKVPLKKEKLDPSDAEGIFEWIGILALTDPVREGVGEALNMAMNANIDVKIITGDYAKTSQFVMSEVGIPVSDEEILTGDVVESISITDLARKVGKIKLFARTTPEQKLKIVDALKMNHEVVAMMGDGVNDAPALHKADIGIVVEKATDVARESAEMVLLNTDFSVIVYAIEEGRAIFENIRKVILYLLSDSFSEIILVVGCIFLGFPLPLTAAQILWINLVSDGLPYFSLTVDPKRRGIMGAKPEEFGHDLVAKWMVVVIGIISILTAVIALVAFAVIFMTTNDIGIARSIVFLTLGLDSLIYVYSVRTLLVPFWKNNIFENKWLNLAVVGGFGLQMLPFISPSLRKFFGLEILNGSYWLIAIGIALLTFFAIEIIKFFYTYFTPTLHRD